MSGAMSLVSSAVELSAPAITLTDVKAAQARIAGTVRHTPLLSSALLDRELGCRVLFKPECLQKTGSFKYRGASNKLAALSEDELANGVVAFSSGNHAQGVAAAAFERGAAATIIMPADAPEIKKAATRAWGATVIEYDRFSESREEIGARIENETGAVLVKPFDDCLVMAGQGTAGLEVVEDCHKLGLAPDIALCCCGGGGLVAGFSTVLKSAHPDCEIYAAEPEDFDDTARSLRSGVREVVDPAARSICDAILTPQPGALTWSVNQHLLSGGLTASDSRVQQAMRAAFAHLKLVVEPGGAIALAALLEAQATGSLDLAGKTVVVMLSGGNVDQAVFQQALASG